MDNKTRFAQIDLYAKSEHEAITMILSACSDMGSANGALLSVKKFDDAAEMILLYQKHLADESTKHDEHEPAAQPAEAVTGETCPFCGALNTVEHKHPIHITSMGATCAASGMTIDEAKERALYLPTMDAQESRQ